MGKYSAFAMYTETTYTCITTKHTYNYQISHDNPTLGWNFGG